MTAIAYELRRRRRAFPLPRRGFPLPRRRTVGRTVALGATAVFLFLFVRSGALGEARAALRGLTPWTLAVSIAAILGGMAFTAVRWRTLLRAAGVEAPLPRLFSALAVSAAANNVLPARGGDVVRIAAVRTAVPVPASAVVGTMLAERLLDGFTLALWIVLGALLAGAGAPLLPIGVALCAGTGTGIALAAIAAAAPERSARLVARVTRALPERARGPVESAAAGALGGLSVFRSGRLLASALASSLALWTCDVVMYGALAHGFGLELGLGGWLLLEGIGNLALAVPASAAGIGSFDYLTLLGARSLGVSAGAAGAYVLTVHALVVLPATVLGGLLARSAFRGSGERQLGADGRAAAGGALELEPAAARLDAVVVPAQPGARVGGLARDAAVAVDARGPSRARDRRGRARLGHRERGAGLNPPTSRAAVRGPTTVPVPSPL